MKEHILDVYNLGLEKFAGDAQKAREFTVGFMKEASAAETAGKAALTGLDLFKGEVFKGMGSALGMGAAGLGLGLAIHGMSSALNSIGTNNLRSKFEAALETSLRSNILLADVDRVKVKSYAETVFKFAPHVACDANLLGPILAHAVQGEGLDSMIIRSLADLEGRIQETKKNALFSPKAYR